MKKLALVFILAVFVNGAAPPKPNPGVVFEIETTDHSSSPPRTESMEMAAEGQNLKIGILPGQGERSVGDWIFRGDRGGLGEAVVIDHQEKSYMVMDEAFMRTMADQAAGAAGAMAEALKNVPADQREAMEKMMREQAEVGVYARMKTLSDPEVRPTGERAEKEGYPCEKYEVSQDGRLIRELWLTDWDNIDGGDEAAEAFRGMGAFFDEFRERMGPLSGGEEFMDGQDFFEVMNTHGGFPVVTRGFGEDGAVEEESRLRSARRRTLDPDEFEPPSGYKRRTMSGGD